MSTWSLMSSGGSCQLIGAFSGKTAPSTNGSHSTLKATVIKTPSSGAFSGTGYLYALTITYGRFPSPC